MSLGFFFFQGAVMAETTLLLTLPDICQLSGLSWWAAYRRARAGAWDGRLVRIAGRNTWVFPRPAVLRWLRQQSARSVRTERPVQKNDAGQERRRASA